MTKAEAARQMRAVQSSAKPTNAPLISVFGVIDDAMADRIAAQMARPMSGTDLAVIINSPGGSLAAAERIYDAIRSHRGRVATKGLSLCCSAAIHVLLAGDVREARADCQFLLHDAEIRPEQAHSVRWTAKAHLMTAAAMERCDAAIARLYADRTGRTAEAFRIEMSDEQGIDAEAALGLRLIHRILR